MGWKIYLDTYIYIETIIYFVQFRKPIISFFYCMTPDVEDFWKIALDLKYGVNLMYIQLRL